MTTGVLCPLFSGQFSSFFFFFDFDVNHFERCVINQSVIIIVIVTVSFFMTEYQWCNRQGAGGRVPPETSDREICADLPGKKRQGKKGKELKIEKKRKKIFKGKVENENGRWKVTK